MRVWIVVTVFDRFDALRNFLECLEAQTYENWKLVIVDHGRSDIDESIRVPVGSVVLKESPRLWWTSALNCGLDYVMNCADEKDRVLIQNDDSSFSDTFIHDMLKCSIDSDCRIVGATAVDRNTGLIIHSNMKFDFLKATYKYLNRGRKAEELSSSLLESDVLKGRGMMFPVEILSNSGLFCESLPQYKSDHEFSFRLKRLGYKLVVSSDAISETILDTQQDVIKGKMLLSIKEKLFNRRSTQNLKDAIIYYSKCYGILAALYLVPVHITRVLVGSYFKTRR